MHALTLLIVGLTYVGMATGRVPGLRIDRAGMALLAASLLLLLRPEVRTTVASAIDVPTLLVLGVLMLVSGQLEVSGFYQVLSARIANAQLSPRGLLYACVAVTGVLSALLTNDVVVFALVPPLVRGLKARDLDARPYVLAAACASNAGSAWTLIGNPQNILIGQAGGLSAWAYSKFALVPTVLSLALIAAVYGHMVGSGRAQTTRVDASSEVILDIPGIAKGLLALVVVLSAVTFGRNDSVLVVVFAALLVSRVHRPREMLARIDMSLLLLFVGLFIVTHAFVQTGTARVLLEGVMHGDMHTGLARMPIFLPVVLIASNTIGNVPFVTLLLNFIRDERALSMLALVSTLAGNMLLTGSVANLIAVERAKAASVQIGFVQHARVAIPVTLATLVIAWAWYAALSHM